MMTHFVSVHLPDKTYQICLICSNPEQIGNFEGRWPVRSGPTIYPVKSCHQNIFVVIIPRSIMFCRYKFHYQISITLSTNKERLSTLSSCVFHLKRYSIIRLVPTNLMPFWCNSGKNERVSVQVLVSEHHIFINQ